MSKRTKEEILQEMQETRTAISALVRGESINRFTSSSGDYLKTYYLETLTLEDLTKHLSSLQIELDTWYPEGGGVAYRCSSTPVIVTKFGV